MFQRVNRRGTDRMSFLENDLGAAPSELATTGQPHLEMLRVSENKGYPVSSLKIQGTGQGSLCTETGEGDTQAYY